MTNRHRLTSVETVEDEGAWLFTVRDAHDTNQEVMLVPCEETGVTAWVNNCTHEDQRLYRDEIGVVTRDGGIVCPKHGSIFDSCSGGCENGPAADTTLLSVDVTVDDGSVYLTDDAVDFLWKGGDSSDDDDSGPSSTSHLTF
ncbi:Ferredoxin subunit of nitrite reductase or a ring-hydroxylating dioxygenase [Halovenus aranensis]|jgi:nitrite reductase/ring-hydroxylating ferredoxin subunit|uniref:Ferredoxin subunit of nitrite reductase or a ring-hydroxylating dioxygenase n=1 Tax=Halovenus aranensis TaxID=890420 RepID=A0A1G8U5Q4_9EURY|nr:Rieske 2Fe-2S domain-containing protein [Halovenus aranensis]SDJ48370.1 Ferredoxin subunit of nitrite reductase or a ring-hydroxylating dioxygenase [Halovenus aranensis]